MVSGGATDALSACWEGVSGSGMLESTRWAAGEGVVVSMAAAVGAACVGVGFVP